MESTKATSYLPNRLMDRPVLGAHRPMPSLFEDLTQHDLFKDSFSAQPQDTRNTEAVFMSDLKAKAELEERVQAKRQEVTSHQSELDALEERIRQMEQKERELTSQLSGKA